MAIAPPQGLMLFSTGQLDGVFSRSSDLYEVMEMRASQLYTGYLVRLGEAHSFKEFWNASFDLTYALKEGFSFYVSLTNLKHLIEIDSRIVVCAYISDQQVLCAHFDVVPENVKELHYMHTPFTYTRH
jgi:hypothetical protein